MQSESTNRSLDIRVGRLVSKEAPVVTVVIPYYCAAEFIAETLNSAFSQTFQDFEVVLVNDASPDRDHLMTAIEEYRDRITLVDKNVNEGVSVSRNRGAELARGEFLIFQDADDLWEPTFLETLVAFVKAGAYDMAYTDSRCFGNSTAAGRTWLDVNPAEGLVTRDMLVCGNCLILVGAAILRKTTFHEVGGFDPRVNRTEDFDLWMRVAFHGSRIGYLRQPLFLYRMKPFGNSGDAIMRRQRLIDQWNLLKEKLEFTESQLLIIDRHIETERASLHRVRARLHLERREWNKAQEEFLGAYNKAIELDLPTGHRLKLQLLRVGITLWPELVRTLARKTRPDDLASMPE